MADLPTHPHAGMNLPAHIVLDEAKMLPRKVKDWLLWTHGRDPTLTRQPDTAAPTTDTVAADLQQFALQSDTDTTETTESSEPTEPLKSRKYKIFKPQCNALCAIARAEEKDPRVLFSMEPTRILYVGNAGSSFGLKAEPCRPFFEKFGELEMLITVSNMSFLYVVYKDVQSAVAAFNAYHYTIVPELSRERTLFIEYGSDTNLSPLYFGCHPLQCQMHDAVVITHPITSIPYSQLSTLIDNNTNLLDGLVPGMLLVTDFLSEEEEQAILADIAEANWNKKNLRSVCHFGYEFTYDNNGANTDAPLHKWPASIDVLHQRMQCLGALALSGHDELVGRNSDGSIIPFMPQQLTINRYDVGDGIPKHTDGHHFFNDIIISTSLAADTVMELAYCSSVPYVSQSQYTLPNPFFFHFPRRAMFLMTGATRYAYTHSIHPRATDKVNGKIIPRATRWSLTWRQLREPPGCHCKYSDLCDTATQNVWPWRDAKPYKPQKGEKAATEKESEAQTDPATVAQ